MVGSYYQTSVVQMQNKTIQLINHLVNIINWRALIGVSNTEKTSMSKITLVLGVFEIARLVLLVSMGFRL